VSVVFAALIVAAPIMLSGCTSVVFGSAVKAGGGPPPGAVDVELLDTGNYPTKPAPPLGAAGSEFNGKLIDASLMAEFVTGPWEVDPAFSKGLINTAMILKSAEALQRGQSKAVVDAVVANGAFIYGFDAVRKTEDDRILGNAVYRFRDPQAAADAAKIMGEAALKADDGTPPEPGKERVAVPIPGHPETLTASRQYVPYLETNPWTAVNSYTARGTYVLAQRAEGPADIDGTPLIAKAIDLQGPAIDKFQPTDPAKFAELPADPTGLIARMLPLAGDSKTVIQQKTFGQHATLLFQDDPVKATPLLAETGVDAFIKATTNVYRAKDAAGAARLVDQFAADVLGGSFDPPFRDAQGVNFMPASRCLEFPGGPKEYDPQRSFYCLAPVENYVIEVQSGQLRDAQQQVAAQYVMLLAK
jgi:hypothetical protein